MPPPPILPGPLETDPSRRSLSKRHPSQDEADSITGSSTECEDKSQTRQHDHEILNLARRFTTQSEYNHHQSPFTAEEGSHLDPKSPHFSAKAWAKAFYNVRYSSDQQLQKVAGIAFRDLNVWGKGTPTDFQTTVGNAVLKAPALFGRGQVKIDILRGVDGLVLPGEQLCVLGPPG